MKLKSAEEISGLHPEAVAGSKKLKDEVLLIKVGGSAMVDEEILSSLLEDIALLKSLGAKPVVVHGGGPYISRALDELDIDTEFHRGMRKTPASVMNVVKQVLVGQVNSMIVELACSKTDCRAVGLYGGDCSLITAKKYSCEDGADLGRVGEVEEVDPGIVRSMLAAGYLPFIAPVGVGQDGRSYNINSDTAACEIAGALDADRFVVLTDVDGVMEDPDEEGSTIEHLTRSEAEKMMENGGINEGMIPKVRSCMRALSCGVNTSYILNGTGEHMLLHELLTAAGTGTRMGSMDQDM